MDPLGGLLTTRPIQTGWEISIEPYPNWQFGCVDNPDNQFGNSSVLARTRTRSDGPEPLLTLCTRRCSLSNLHTWDGEMQLNTSMGETTSTEQLSWLSRQSFNSSQKMMPLHVCLHHVESVCRLLIASPENCKCHKWPINKEVVIWGYASKNPGQRNVRVSPACRCAGSITNEEIEVRCTPKLWLLYKVCLANNHNEIWVKWRTDNGTCIAREVNSQIAICDHISLGNATCSLILLLVSFSLILVITFWHMIIHLCMWNGRMGHAKVLPCKLPRSMTNALHMVLLWLGKSESW
jgi:hypothetical protein